MIKYLIRENSISSKSIAVFAAKILAILTAFTALSSLSGCTKKTLDTSYYLIEFASNASNPQLVPPVPFPYRVQVINFKIPRSYDSIRIIARYSSHQINYYRYSLWAVRPQIAVADLLAQQISAYRMFKDCQREFLDEAPDYEITGEIQQVERFESESYSAAHLKMAFYFYDYNKKDKILSYDFDREIPIPTGGMTIFAKAISDLVQEESENFLIRIYDHFASKAADSTSTSGAVGK